MEGILQGILNNNEAQIEEVDMSDIQPGEAPIQPANDSSQSDINSFFNMLRRGEDVQPPPGMNPLIPPNPHAQQNQPHLFPPVPPNLPNAPFNPLGSAMSFDRPFSNPPPVLNPPAEDPPASNPPAAENPVPDQAEQVSSNTVMVNAEDDQVADEPPI